MTHTIDFVMPLPKGYLRVAVDTDLAWPDTEVILQFRGHSITLSPETDAHLPSMMIHFEGAFTQIDAERVLCEAATALTWAEGFGIKLTFGFASTSRNLMPGRSPLRGPSGGRHFSYLPTSSDAQTRLALALFREALTVNLVPYKFLAFYRIVNLHAGKGKKQIAWINSELPLLNDRDAVARLQVLTPAEPDIGRYLYVQGRCAAAHASLTQPTINPDDPTDTIRLTQDLPIIRALAARIIEHPLRVPTFLSLPDPYKPKHSVSQ